MCMHMCVNIYIYSIKCLEVYDSVLIKWKILNVTLQFCEYEGDEWPTASRKGECVWVYMYACIFSFSSSWGGGWGVAKVCTLIIWLWLSDVICTCTHDFFWKLIKILNEICEISLVFGVFPTNLNCVLCEVPYNGRSNPIRSQQVTERWTEVISL